jgi:hypothetical protein
MNRALSASLVLALSLACTPKRVSTVQASATIEDLPNEAVDGGAEAAATGAATAVAARDAGAVEAMPLTRYGVPEGFSVLFPVEPQVQRNSVADKLGTYQAVRFDTNVNGVVFVVSRLEYPEAAFTKLGPKKILAQGRNGIASQVKGKPTDEQDLELDGFPGQTFSVVGQDRLIRARTVVVKNQLYTLVVVYTGPTPEKAEAFLGSLELSKAAPAAAAR